MRRILFASLVLLVSVRPSLADDDYSWSRNDYDYAKSTLDNFYDRTYWDMVSPTSKRQHEKPAREISTTIVPRKQARMPEVLAASDGAQGRSERAAFYRELYNGYAAFAKQVDVPKHDVAAAVAAFIAGTYMMYRQVELDTQTYKRLVEQMRARLRTMPDFYNLPLADKQDMYEQSAIVGMMMANARLAKRDMRAQAKAWLEWLFKVDADRIEITKQGIVRVTQ